MWNHKLNKSLLFTVSVSWIYTTQKKPFISPVFFISIYLIWLLGDNNWVLQYISNLCPLLFLTGFLQWTLCGTKGGKQWNRCVMLHPFMKRINILHTAIPKCIMNPGGYLDMVRNGYSIISKLSWFTDGRTIAGPCLNWPPIVEERSLPVKLLPEKKGIERNSTCLMLV